MGHRSLPLRQRLHRFLKKNYKQGDQFVLFYVSLTDQKSKIGPHPHHIAHWLVEAYTSSEDADVPAYQSDFP